MNKLQTRSRRNRNQQPSAQLSLFDLLPTQEEQKNMIREAAQNTFGAAFSMPQQIIDEVLCDGTNEKDSVLRTCIEFSKNKTLSEKAEYLKNEYGTDGKGFLLNGARYPHYGIKTVSVFPTEPPPRTPILSFRGRTPQSGLTSFWI